MHLSSLLTTAARRRGQAVALRHAGIDVTYAQLEDQVDRLAAELLARGVAKGDRVVLLSGNGPEFAVAVLSALRVGAIMVPINSRSAPGELDYFLSDSGATTLLVTPALAGTVRAWETSSTRTTSPNVLALGPIEGLEDVLAAAAVREAPGPDPVDVGIEESDDALIIYTSGTTGFPKGALFDHHRILWVGAMAIGTIGFLDREYMLVATPMYHSATLNLLFFPCLMLGGTFSITGPFDPATTLDLVESERATFFFGVPTMLIHMTQAARARERDLSSLRIVAYGAAPMPGEAAAALLETFPSVRFLQMCGQTEGGPNGLMLTHEEITIRPSASGRDATPFTEVRIVDPMGQDVGPGEVGEMIFRGETMMKGYWNKPEATADTIRDGWCHSGDLARVDEDGFITLVDRMKDLIITGGRNVYSAEVENVLTTHPAVADLAIVGRPHPEYGETIVAVVTPAPGAEVTLEDLRAYGAEALADFKLPRELVIDEIPRNPSGKVLKRRIRDRLTTEDDTAATAS